MAVEAVYGDLDGMGQQIMEWTLGLHGSPMLSNQEIAQKLKLSASAVSQRKAVIQKRLDAMLDIGLF
jgi:DNA-directed RNA polymerase specialized sigma subunit